jgi:hypothetical protein
MDSKRITDLIANGEHKKALDLLVPIVIKQDSVINKQGRELEKQKQQIEILRKAVGNLNANFTNKRGIYDYESMY